VTFRVVPAPPQTIVSWWDDANELDLEPVYQRKGAIWSTRQNQDLIDTILNSFDIPKLYFADFTLMDSSLNAKRKKYAVIDGKQRMLAIFGFFEGKFTLSKSFIYLENPELKLAGLSYADLTANYPRIARKFENGSLSIMSVVTDDEQKINELFIRLNSSKPLAGAEVRNAMIGEVPELIRKLSEHRFWNRTKFNTQRGQDKNTAAKLLLIEHAGTFVDTKKRQLDALVIKANSTVTDPANASNATQVVNSNPAAEDVEKEIEPLGIPNDTFEDDTVTAEDVADAAIGSESSDIARSCDRVLRILELLYPRFVDGDELLAQQSQIPVIYWLAREVDPSALAPLRPFLQEFDAERARNKLLETGDPKVDPALLSYELMARTSNDQASIAGRYRIMRERFDDYLKRHPLATATPTS
jgi:hypothetical protein